MYSKKNSKDNHVSYSTLDNKPVKVEILYAPKLLIMAALKAQEEKRRMMRGKRRNRTEKVPFHSG